MNSFTITLDDKTIAWYKAMHSAREHEAQLWLAVRSALKAYMTEFLQTEIDFYVSDFREITVADLIDEIAEEIQEEKGA